MVDTLTIDDRTVSTFDKDVFSDYRSTWTRDEDATEVDIESRTVPQYSKHFPAVGEYPDEIYENCGCLPVDEVRDRLRVGQEVVFWTSPPCCDNAYLADSVVRELPPVEHTHTIGEPAVVSDGHIKCHNGQAFGAGFGPMTWTVRLDCIVRLI